jgi:hypothetical protein
MLVALPYVPVVLTGCVPFMQEEFIFFIGLAVAMALALGLVWVVFKRRN